MTYPETIKYLKSFIDYERTPAWPYQETLKLERFKEFLKEIANPQLYLRSIQVAGSKGKGSTCAYITYILRQAGFKVGLYTSPHLSDFRERIRILGQRSRVKGQRADFEGMISRRQLAGLASKLKPAIEQFNRCSKYGPLTFFEVYTALAFVYFKEKKVDFTVLETGLGGRLDATNTQDSLVSVITPISYEHTHLLGKTLREIATEKAGIIKPPSSKLKAPSSIIISAPQHKEALKAIKDRCKKVGAKLWVVGKDIRVSRLQGYSVRSRYGEYRKIKLRLVGEHQLNNAAAAIGAVEALRLYGYKIKTCSIISGLFNTLWPGRCEVIARHPFIVLDGAQNQASSRVLKKAIRKNFCYQRLILVLGISSDKDIAGICRELIPLADELILTQADNPRAASVDTIAGIIARQINASCPILKAAKVQKALGLAKSIARGKDLILVTGSLFVVGQAREQFYE